MNQKQLTKSIEEGINNSFPVQALKIVIYMILVMEIIFLGAIGYSYYQDQKWEKEFCGENGCPTIAMAQAPDKCTLGRLNCVVVSKNLEKDINTSGFGTVLNPGGGLLPVIWEKKGLCGHGEANSWFEQYRNRINGGNELYLECY